MALILSYGGSTSGGPGYVNFAGLDINIDGAISEHKTTGLTTHDNSGYTTVSRTIYTESSNAVVIPLATLQKMMDAKDVRLRVNTSRGSEEAQFSIERTAGGQSTAIMHLREFMSRVRSVSQQAAK